MHVTQDQCQRILHGFVERLECVTEGGRKDIEAAVDIDGKSLCLCACVVGTQKHVTGV